MKWLVATANFIGCVPIQRLMNTVLVVVVHERIEFSFKVLRNVQNPQVRFPLVIEE